MIDKNTMRDLVRAVIAEEVAAMRKGQSMRKDQAESARAPAEERVSVASDADLIAFARRVLSLAGDPTKAKEIAAGRYPFRLDRPGAPQAHAPAPPSSSSSGGTHRIDTGVVTESILNKLPRGLAKLLLGPGVTVTPLAKDRARSLGLTFERTKP